jgi:hypothetical protein
MRRTAGRALRSFIPPESRTMKALVALIKIPIKALLIAVACTIGLVSVAFAADAPLIAAPAALPEWLVPLWNSVVTAAALAGVLTHVRALIPNTGAWAVVGKALDWFVGNYLNAKNTTPAA